MELTARDFERQRTDVWGRAIRHSESNKPDWQKLWCFILNCILSRVDGWQQRHRIVGFSSPPCRCPEHLWWYIHLIMQPSWDVSLTSEAMMYNCNWLSWNSFYPVVHPSSHGEGGVTPLPGCPIYSDATRYTWLSQNGYGLKLLIRTNSWLISIMIVAICMQIF